MPFFKGSEEKGFWQLSQKPGREPEWRNTLGRGYVAHTGIGLEPGEAYFIADGFVDTHTLKNPREATGIEIAHYVSSLPSFSGNAAPTHDGP